MKSLNLCSRLPNLFEITHLKNGNKFDILIQEVLILFNYVVKATCKCLHLPLCIFPPLERRTWK